MELYNKEKSVWTKFYPLVHFEPSKLTQIEAHMILEWETLSKHRKSSCLSSNLHLGIYLSCESQRKIKMDCHTEKTLLPEYETKSKHNNNSPFLSYIKEYSSKVCLNE